MDDKTKETVKAKVGRRGFIQGAVVSGVGAVASGSLAVAQKQTAEPAVCKMSWEIAPPPIPPAEIKNTVTADVVVIGAGVAGVVTALSAAEGGLKVVVIEKMKKFSARGFDVAAVDSRLQKKMGIKIDVPTAVRALIKNCDKQVNEEFFWMFAQYS